MSNETDMWKAMQKETGPGIAFNRIECYTLAGVADLEYVSLYTHGWIEGKIASVKDDASPIRLQHPLSAAQAIWLTDHHRPSIKLRSWLLLGVDFKHHGRPIRLFRFFLLMAPRTATRFLNPRSPSYNDLITDGAAICFTVTDLVELIKKGGVR